MKPFHVLLALAVLASTAGGAAQRPPRVFDFMREGGMKMAIEVLKLNLLAYPDSADANENLAAAYLQHGQNELARQQGGASAAAAARKPGTTFRECPDCPEMVVIPAGDFTMGSSPAEKSWAASHGASPESVADESPQHRVSLRSFALGKGDVTRAEYAAFVRETGYRAKGGCGRDSFKWNEQPDLTWQNPGFNQTDRDPVVCVSWQDARAYIDWLNHKVGGAASAGNSGAYRLPSESEWEYAARAGTTTRFWWGDEEAAASQHAWYRDNSAGGTHPVGSKGANHFGLFDMAGNVWQWTEDCYADSYARAPADGSPAEAGDACLRVDRGGAWLYPAWLLRPATRERNPASYRDRIMGFRVARTLP